MSIIDFPSGGDDTPKQAFIEITYELPQGEQAIASGMGYLTQVGFFACISPNFPDGSSSSVPPIMVNIERIIRIDTHEAASVN